MEENIVNLAQYRLLDSKDVATVLNVSVPFAYKLMQTGTIRTMHIGRSVRVHMADLLAYIETQRANAK